MNQNPLSKTHTPRSSHSFSIPKSVWMICTSLHTLVRISASRNLLNAHTERQNRKDPSGIRITYLTYDVTACTFYYMTCRKQVSDLLAAPTTRATKPHNTVYSPPSFQKMRPEPQTLGEQSSFTGPPLTSTVR